MWISDFLLYFAVPWEWLFLGQDVFLSPDVLATLADYIDGDMVRVCEV